MRKKTIVAFLLLAGLPAAGLYAGALAGQERAEAPDEALQEDGQASQVPGLSENEVLEDFINMVWLISTNRERSAWRDAGTNEQKEALVAEFWRERDPTPGTEVNEYRDLYMKRVAAANRKFSEGDVPGYRTDRGQFILIYSEDAILEQERRRLSSDQEAADAGGEPAVSPSFRIIWIIDPAINPYLEGMQQIVFEQSEGGYSFIGQEVTLDQGALLAHRDLQTLFSLLLAGSRAATPATTGAATPGGAEAAPVAEDAAAVRLSNAGEAMRQLIDEGIARNDIGLRFETSFFPAPENNTYMVVAFKVDKEALTFAEAASLPGGGVAGAVAESASAGEAGAVEAGDASDQAAAGAIDVPLPPAALHAFGFLLQERSAGPEQLLRQMAMEFLVESTEGRDGASRTYSFGMTLVPGSYRLAWGVMDDLSERITTLSTPFDVPNYGTGSLTLTSVLVARPPMVEQSEIIDIDKVYEGVRIGNIQLDVDIDRHFERDDTIELLYFVMGAGIDPLSQQPQLEVEHTLLRGESDEGIARLPTQTLNYFAIGQQIPLGQVANIEPGGSYRILISVKDIVSESELTYEVPFTVAGDGPAQ